MSKRRKTGALDSYSVYDARGRRIVGGVDREVALRVKAEARAQGKHDVKMIRRGQEGKEPGPRKLDV